MTILMRLFREVIRLYKHLIALSQYSELSGIHVVLTGLLT